MEVFAAAWNTYRSLALVLAIALICISCGSVAQADPRGNAVCAVGIAANGSVSHSYNTVLSSAAQFAVSVLRRLRQVAAGPHFERGHRVVHRRALQRGNYTFA